MYNPFPFLGFIFWCGLFTWFGIRAWARYLTELERQKTLRAFAERGTPLDKDMIEKLFPAMAFRQPPPSWQPSPQLVPRGLAIAGIVLLFAGGGLLIGAQLISRIEPRALYAMSTGAVMVIAVGLGLLTASWALRRMQASDKAQTSGAGDEVR